jgi:hypothetical protein
MRQDGTVFGEDARYNAYPLQMRRKAASSQTVTRARLSTTWPQEQSRSAKRALFDL